MLFNELDILVQGKSNTYDSAEWSDLVNISSGEIDKVVVHEATFKAAELRIPSDRPEGLITTDLKKIKKIRDLLVDMAPKVSLSVALERIVFEGNSDDFNATLGRAKQIITGNLSDIAEPISERTVQVLLLQLLVMILDGKIEVGDDNDFVVDIPCNTRMITAPIILLDVSLLLVQNDAAMTGLIMSWFMTDQIILATNLESATVLFRSTRFTAVIVDLDMVGVVSGTDISRTLRVLEDRKHTTFVGISSTLEINPFMDIVLTKNVNLQKELMDHLGSIEIKKPAIFIKRDTRNRATVMVTQK